MKTLLVIGHVWPEPTSSAAGRRMLQLMSVFHNAGYHIVFACAAEKSSYATEFLFPVDEVEIQLNDAMADDFLRKLKPDVVLFDRFMTEEQYGWRVAEQCPKALRILDTEDLHFLRKARESTLKESRNVLPEDFLTSVLAKREIASIYRCDLSLIISTFEMELLNTLFGIKKALLFYLPFLVDCSSLPKKTDLPGFGQRQHFISIGNFLHAPNRDAVQYLKREIWPLIKKELPQVEIHVYGAYAKQRDEQLEDKGTGFLVKARAEDAYEVIQSARVMLAPLRFGAGLKGKLLDAMICGTPSITTTIGAEGMQDPLEWCGAICDDQKVFAKEAIQLYQTQEDWEIASDRGRQIVEHEFDQKRFIPRFLERLNDLTKHIKTHRQHNFIGSMLLHHSLQSTKYLSKWIEEKNQK
ncbi:glycosyltransferase family 4 protein [Gangjinia marincola]|uniref:Glycosyltransferase family 4 protein n=1 Tax=Gangjinia marincola TaxID=578463 RepID=A0ABP3Y1D5_9FLAO